jgi:hypothetical protein
LLKYANYLEKQGIGFLGVYYSMVKIIAVFPGMGMGLASGSFSLLKIITDQFINDGRE